MTGQSAARPVVLAVDDEPGVRDLSTRILEQGGYRVLAAADGRQALEIVNGGAAIDLLMVDLDMPIMRGEELAQRVRQARPGLCVLYVTAQSGALFTERPELTAREAFLDKPFSVRGLLEAVSLLRNGYINPPPESAAECLWRTVVAKVGRS
jgi:two-component system cell cycle sensor histidine kinase/response regulator CckA